LLDKWVAPADVAVASEELARIQAVLDTRRLLATRVEVKNARLLPVAIHVTLEQPQAGIRYDSGRVAAVLEEHLYRHLDPWRQVTEGRSPFGGRLSRQDVSHWLHGCPEAIWVTDIVLLAADPASGDAFENPSAGTRTDMVLVDEDTVLISGKHRVRPAAAGTV
jgi:hypothetical protein